MSEKNLVDIAHDSSGDVRSRGNSQAPAWRIELGLPELATGRVTLRELKLSDASSLQANLSTEDVQRYISPAPATLAGFERFIRWTVRKRKAGQFLAYGIVPRGEDHAVGILQAWPLHDGFRTAEAGVALGSAFWGTGLFLESASLFLAFMFDTLDVQRLEGRAAMPNLRGNAAVRKLGAVEEGLLRKCFFLHGEYVDHVLWSLLADEWRRRSNRM